MPQAWQGGLLSGIVAVAAIGALLQISPLSARVDAQRVDARVVHEQPVAPAACITASCNKESPSAPTPSMRIASLWAVLLGMLACAVLRVSKRFRPSTTRLPLGNAAPLFHPPRFS